MFERVAIDDMGVIARGLLLLLIIVVIGVGVAEHQLATLTQRPEQERFFYIGRNQDYVYSAYVFGYGLQLGTMYLADHSITIPLKIAVDGSRLWYWLDIWHRQFVEEAFAAKSKVIEYWKQAKPYVETAFQTLRTKTQSSIEQMGEYIQEYR